MPGRRQTLTRSVATAAALALLVVTAGCASTNTGTGSLSTPDSTSAASANPSSTATPSPAAPSEPPSTSATPPPAAQPRPAGLPPASVSIPAIDLDEPLIDLGIQSDGSMEVPTDFGDVGWFTGGGKPGGRGPTVIAGHVDSSVGPAVFFRLDELQPGDVVDVTDTSGTVFSYTVDRAADYAKSDFPTAAVFGAVAADELRLITCSGLFDDAVGHYEDNRVVFASRTP